MRIQESSRRLFSSGEKPFAEEVIKDASNYFSKHRVGQPFSMGDFVISDKLTSDPELINLLALSTVINLSVLYQSALMQAQNVDNLKNVLFAANKKMTQRRNQLEDLIDGYLLGSFNADGYFYSVIEKFNSLTNVDLTLTSAFVDIPAKAATIPALASGTTRIGSQDVASVSVISYLSTAPARSGDAAGAPSPEEVPIPLKSNYDFITCMDTREDTSWNAGVSLNEEESVMVKINIAFNESSAPVVVSRIEADLFGVTPTQMFVETISTGDPTPKDFGDMVLTGTERLVFSDTGREIKGLTIFLRKDKADIVHDIGGKHKYDYIFGFKNLFITKSTYDVSAVLVSQPFSLPQEDYGDAFIDAVSLDADSTLPEGTSIEYFVATDDGSQNWLDDFGWKRIDPINLENPETSVVRFDGVTSGVKMIRSNPTSEDLQLIPINTTATAYIDMNPSPNIAPNGNVYRIALFDEDVIPATLKLEEGVNTTRIRYTNYSNVAVANGLDFWKDVIDLPTTKLAYGSVATGNGFFYGGDIGENGRSVYVETYLESKDIQSNIIKDFKKLDTNSLLWDVRVYLNGSEVARLEPGVEMKAIPWTFRKGLNHIALCVNIPNLTASGGVPYSGNLDIMVGDEIGSYGTIKLANWSYVDIFKLKYNEVGSPYTFSISNNEIVSRRKPTNNLRISYSKPTGLSPAGIRFRCNFMRSSNHQTVTPTLNSYKLRFSYGEKE